MEDFCLLFPFLCHENTKIRFIQNEAFWLCFGFFWFSFGFYIYFFFDFLKDDDETV